MKLIDIHSHRKKNDDAIEVLVKDFSLNEKLEGRYDCIGIHPWRIPLDNYELTLKKFDEYLGINKPWILGEMGLDRAISQDFDLQIKLFQSQINLARKHKIPNIVIHCVRAYSDVLKILIDSKFQGNVILHDFNSTSDTATQFSSHFPTYFSFGKKITDSQTKASKCLRDIPLNRLFFETDDNQDIEISAIYIEAAKKLDMNLEELITQVFKNFENLNCALFTDSFN